jgi:hypothetical protein
MMWINVLLLLMLDLSPASYVNQVRALNERGCRVYNYYWVSCPNSTGPGAIPIPEDAVEVIVN